MKILAIDTSSKTCGVCLLEDEKKVYEENLITDRSHSVKLMPIIENAFSKAGISLKDIDLIVCDKGPGSFTGIRIGVATAKAFADSLNKTLIGISSLETLASCMLLTYVPGKYNNFVCSILDAKNDNCYLSLYYVDSEKNDKKINYKEILSPFSADINTAIQILKVHATSPITFIGDGAESFKDKLQSEFQDAKFATDNLLHSYNLGLVGYLKYLDNNIESSLPMYLKKPQAQRQLEEKK